MPVHPHPTTYSCQACGWSKTVVHQSDVLCEHYKTCPACGEESIRKAKAGVVSSASARLVQAVKAFFS